MIREVLRLHHSCGLSHKKVAAALKISHGAVGEYLKRAEAAGLSWPLGSDFDDEQLELKLYPKVVASKEGCRPQPDCKAIREELKKKGVTLSQLWAEYREEHPQGYGLSQFCDIYKKFNHVQAITMRMQHEAGDKAFSDFAGSTLSIVSEVTGEVHQAHLFVCTLGASSFTFAKLYSAETTESWSNGHAEAFSFFGGTPVKIVPDNPKAVITTASRYEPEINASFAQMAAHFDVAVLPARVRKPQDKAKVEAAVGLATRWILAVLRKRTFFSVKEANDAVAILLRGLNDKPFQKRPGSRQSLFDELDKPALRPLPITKYEFCEIRTATINMDYHFAFENHNYSVPFKYRFGKVILRVTTTTIEVLLGNRRIASHARKYSPGGFTTLPEHQPREHRDYGNWSPGIIVERGNKIGPATGALFSAIMVARPVAEQGFRSCMGILQLEKTFGKERLDAACSRALAIRGLSYKSVKSLLRTGLEARPLPETPVQLRLVHSNLRETNSFMTPISLEIQHVNSSDDRQSQNSQTVCNGERSGEPASNEEFTGT
jgi:transposase